MLGRKKLPSVNRGSPQARYCYGLLERRVNVETLKQVSPILVFLLLVLLDGGEVFSCLSLPLGVLVMLVLDVMLVLFNGGEPVVEAGALHLLLMIAHEMVMVAIGREGHTSSLIDTQDFFIWLLLIVVEVETLPLLT